jgi:tetratricopeptide (TPR) repeat protein
MRDAQRLVGLIHEGLGKTLEQQNNLTEAEHEYRQAIAIEGALGDPIASSICHTALAELLLKRGKVQEAEKEGHEALNFARTGGDLQTQAQALIVLAQLCHQTADSTAVDDLFTQALELLDASHAHEIAAAAYFRFAKLLEERSEVQRSLQAMKRAYAHQWQGQYSDGE